MGRIGCPKTLVQTTTQRWVTSQKSADTNEEAARHTHVSNWTERILYKKHASGMKGTDFVEPKEISTSKEVRK
jgi:hypothetical protein